MYLGIYLCYVAMHVLQQNFVILLGQHLSALADTGVHLHGLNSTLFRLAIGLCLGFEEFQIISITVWK